MLALALALVLGNTDLIERCASAAEKAEPLKRAGHFTEALELLKVCSVDACPKVVKEQCRILRADASTQVPTCVLKVQDDSHGEVPGLEVLLDGAHIGPQREPSRWTRAFTRSTSRPTGSRNSTSRSSCAQPRSCAPSW